MSDLTIGLFTGMNLVIGLWVFLVYRLVRNEAVVKELLERKETSGDES